MNINKDIVEGKDKWLGLMEFVYKAKQKEGSSIIDHELIGRINKMAMENKTLEELLELVQSPEFDDVNDDLAFEIVDRISELKRLEAIEGNPFKGLSLATTIEVGDLPEGMMELNKKMEEKDEREDTELQR